MPHPHPCWRSTALLLQCPTLATIQDPVTSATSMEEASTKNRFALRKKKKSGGNPNTALMSPVVALSIIRGLCTPVYSLGKVSDS
uniref:Secreted protein n=1 Tax=Rhipicephalus appendiculatus TaxID=34631 RepID=A0A131YBK1_RHIAP